MAMLEVRNLSVHFATRRGVLPAVDDASFQVEAGKTLALVGESGCGKSVAAASILRLVPSPPGRVAAGQIFFEGRDILSLPMDEMRALRGSSIGMVFQEPMTSLNPVLTIGDQIAEVVRAHEGATRVAAAMQVSGAGGGRVGSHAGLAYTTCTIYACESSKLSPSVK